MEPSIRVTRKISAANIDRRERRWTGNGSRANYSARAARRAERRDVKSRLRAMAR